jgi:hypothetical protein
MFNEPIVESILNFQRSCMFDNLLATAGSKHARLLIAGIGFVMLMMITGRVHAANLPLPVLLTPIEQSQFNKFLADRPVPQTEKERRRLFDEFMAWRKTQ